MKLKKDTDEYIGSRVRAARVAAEKTQAQGGAILGVTWQQFAKYETGKNRITAVALAKLAKAFRVDPSFFFE